jgi:hypothetical protein
MEKEFVPYELALRMKALGFDESCFGVYDNDDDNTFYEIRSSYSIGFSKNIEGRVLALTWQSAFRWFREKYKIEATTSCFYSKRLDIPYEERQYHCHIIRDGVTSKGPKYKTYEEAETACLKKLIEIVEESKS